jgi:hypothetical protein
LGWKVAYASHQLWLEKQKEEEQKAKAEIIDKDAGFQRHEELPSMPKS